MEYGIWKNGPGYLLPSTFYLPISASMDAEIGAHGARETPVPIPNTVVKPRSGYNTWGPPLGK
jgi:hypothetical protein